jgi:hypothetical protein
MSCSSAMNYQMIFEDEVSTTQSSVISTGLFFLLIFLSGFRLSRSGKPYSVVIFTIHKLIGMATGIFLVMTVYPIYQAFSFSPIEITAIVITVLFLVVTVAAGALLSIDKPMPVVISVVHKVSPYLITLSTAVALYLLLSRK